MVKPAHESSRSGCVTRKSKVRPAFAALPLAVAATFVARQMSHGVGVDELSLLAMGQALRDGALPYTLYWDVRMPLTYLWGFVSASADAMRSVATLRTLAWAAHMGAAWLFFCLFQRTLGRPAAAVGAVVLLAAANATALHEVALPNHFAMAMSLVAFACLVAGLRGRPAPYLASALLAGALPWTMAQTSLLAGALAVAAVLGPSWAIGRRAEKRQCVDGSPSAALRFGWVAVAAVPTVALLAVYGLSGQLDVFLRTVLAPLDVLGMRGKSGYAFFSAADLEYLLRQSPWVLLDVLLLAAGAVWLFGAIRSAPDRSALRLVAYFALPTAVGFALMAYAKPPAPPEYWIELAPVVGLLAAVAVSRILAWRVWSRPWIAERARAAVLKPCLGAFLGCALVLPVDPWAKPEEDAEPVPIAYCDAVVRALGRIGSGETVLDAVGICGFHILNAGGRLHPPFTFTPLWLRQLQFPWVGMALDGDGSRQAAVERLREALRPGSGVGVVLADGRLLGEVREQGWQRSFHKDWRGVYFRRLEGRETGEPFARLAVYVRRPSLAGDGS